MGNIGDDNKLNYAMSCTVDAAAMYLMGYTQGEIQLQWCKNLEDPSDEDRFNVISYSDLAIEYGNAKTALEELQAIKDKITKNLAKLEDENNNRLDEAIIVKQTEYEEAYNKFWKARAYENAIKNEISKGIPLSNLHIDITATNDLSNPYITLESLKTWAKKVFKITILHDLETFTPEKPLPKMRQQENAIVDTIKKLGYDPQKLPKNPSGKPGVKAEIREKIQFPPLFNNANIFDKAWDRLSKYKDIIILK